MAKKIINILNGSNPFAASTWKKYQLSFLDTVTLYPHVFFDFKHIERFTVHYLEIPQEEGSGLPFVTLLFWKKKRKQKRRMVSNDGITVKSRPFLPFSPTLFHLSANQTLTPYLLPLPTKRCQYSESRTPMMLQKFSKKQA